MRTSMAASADGTQSTPVPGYRWSRVGRRKRDFDVQTHPQASRGGADRL